MATNAYLRSSADFVSRGTRCAASLYLPTSADRPPVVIMAHGFGAERTFGLEPFAERFAEAGIAALFFDYRCFGGSDGEPRNWISPRRHIQDWEAALAYAKTLTPIDPERIGVWGTSFSSGHVIVLAARHPEVSAVVAQVPFTDGLSFLFLTPPKTTLSLAWAALRDVVAMAVRRRPFNVPIVGRTDTVAMLAMPGALEGYLALVPAETSWTNACPARVALTAPLYRPVRHAAGVAGHVLVVAAPRDNVVPFRYVEKALRRFPHAELVSFDGTHFDLYTGPTFEKVVSAEESFLGLHLGVRRGSPAMPS